MANDFEIKFWWRIYLSYKMSWQILTKLKFWKIWRLKIFQNFQYLAKDFSHLKYLTKNYSSFWIFKKRWNAKFWRKNFATLKIRRKNFSIEILWRRERFFEDFSQHFWKTSNLNVIKSRPNSQNFKKLLWPGGDQY